MRCSAAFAILVLPAVGFGSESGGLDPKCSAAGSSCDAGSLLQTAGVRFQGADDHQVDDDKVLVPESPPARTGAEENAPVPVMAPMKLLEALQVKGNSGVHHAVPHLTPKEAHHHIEAGLLQEKATVQGFKVGFQEDAQAEARNVQTGALFIFAIIFSALVLSVAWIAVKQIFGIGSSEETADDSDPFLIKGIKRVFGVGLSEAVDENSDPVKPEVIKDSDLDEIRAKMQEGDVTTSEVDAAKAADATETPAAPVARSPLDELRARIQEADQTVAEVNAKLAAKPIS